MDTSIKLLYPLTLSGTSWSFSLMNLLCQIEFLSFVYLTDFRICTAVSQSELNVFQREAVLRAVHVLLRILGMPARAAGCRNWDPRTCDKH